MGLSRFMSIYQTNTKTLLKIAAALIVTKFDGGVLWGNFFMLIFKKRDISRSLPRSSSECGVEISSTFSFLTMSSVIFTYTHDPYFYSYIEVW